MKDADYEAAYKVGVEQRSTSMRADKVTLNGMVLLSGCLVVFGLVFWLFPEEPSRKAETFFGLVAASIFALGAWFAADMNDWPPFDRG